MSTKNVQNVRKNNPLKEYLDNSSMTLAAVARAAKIHRNTVCKIYWGKVRPCKRTVAKLCKALNFAISPGDFEND